jgi:hypothetical protein
MSSVRKAITTTTHVGDAERRMSSVSWESTELKTSASARIETPIPIAARKSVPDDILSDA